MATRRARIKAVTSLPPRRKNNKVADNTKTNILENEIIEKPIRSPRTPRGSIKAQDNIDRGSPKPGSPLKSPRPVNNVFNQYQAEIVPSPLAQSEVIKEVAVPLNRSEKVSVITSVKPNVNVFVSPRNVGSPLIRRHVESPLVHSSKVEVDVQRLTTVTTPEKNLKKPKQKFIERRAVEVDVTDGKSKEIEMDVVITVPADVPDDYSVPSVPESITEETVMDGIVPLQAVSSAPKPLAFLKNEIISENAEVLFDPIVPLPSPSKVRPKLRPVPRLAPMRRNSVQGSASESEDESRRALLSGGGVSTPAPPRQRHDSHTSHSTMLSLPHREVNRIRNDSMCSSVSLATTQPPAASSPVKEKHPSKARRLDMSRRMTAMRRRRETVKKDSLTMYDLIFYNPSSNPIIPDKDELEAQQANEREEAARNASTRQVEDNVDDPPEVDTDAAPVPQIKLGPNGEIMLDEQSLVIKQSDKRKVSSSIVHEGAWTGGTGSVSGRYRRTQRTADWNDAETVRFYRALATLGTDFMLMESLFPGRTRRDLKLKFKKEERVNMAQVDKALRSTNQWDAVRLKEEFDAEREEDDKAARAEAQELQQRAIDQRQRQKEARELRVRMSRGSKALGASTLPSSTTDLTADQFILRHHEAKANTAKMTPQPKPKRGRPKSTAIMTISTKSKSKGPTEVVTIRKIAAKPEAETTDNQPPTTPVVSLPPNIENGSLVVLTVDDPNSPSKKMLQTYISGDGGRLTPVALPPSFLNSVVTYMTKGGTPKSNMSAGSSPRVASPSSVASQDSRPCSTPGVIQMNNSPKRKRHSSYTITHL